MKSPMITVFMAAYNSDLFISEAISSILLQTYSDFELLIINDGSTDNTVSVIQSFLDERIRLLHNPKNMGLVFTRNRALEEARGKYIAVLDSDDVAHPQRLQWQYDFMVQNRDIALCSGHAEIIDGNGHLTGEKFIVPTVEQVAMYMLFGNPFINSAAIFKSSVFRELNGYRNYAPAEDFDFFLRVAEHYPVANIDRILVKYRKHEGSTSLSRTFNIKDVETKILGDMHRSLEMQVDEAFTETHYHLFSRNYSSSTFSEFLGVLNQLKLANRRVKKFPKEQFEELIFAKWFEILTIKKAGIHAFPLLFKGEVFKNSYLTFKHLRRSFKQTLRGLFQIGPNTK